MNESEKSMADPDRFYASKVFGAKNPVILTLFGIMLIGLWACRSGSGESENLELPVNPPKPKAFLIYEEKDWADYFGESASQACFVLTELNSLEIRAHNPERALVGYLPASTFKIFNTLFFLEEGIVQDEKEIIPWDGVNRGWAKWDRSQSLDSAFRYSSVWVYQKLVQQSTDKRMREQLLFSGYGNMQTGPLLNQFWLDGDIRINALEQVEFIKKLLKGKLPFSAETMATTRRVMFEEAGPGWRLSAKTGLTDQEPMLGWYVGFLETETQTWVFALNMDLDDFEKRSLRKEITLSILQAEGLM